MFINPGSTVRNGTEKQAIINANNWLLEMRKNGIRNVQIVGDPVHDYEFRWTFVLKHSLTGVEATLKIHGLNEQQLKNYIDSSPVGASPRIYWNGSSTAEPKLGDFLTEGYYIDIIKE